MKWLLFFFIVIIHSESNGQSKKFPPDSISGRNANMPPSILILKSSVDTAVLIKRHNDGNPPVFYLNSMLLVDMPFIDVNSIEDIRIENGFDSTYKRNGKIYITSKKDSKLHLLSATDIKIKYSIQTDKNQTLWMIDNDIIERIAYFRIDSSNLYKIEVQELPTIDSLHKATSGITVIRIYTKTKENITRFSELRLRGSGTM